MASRLFDFPIFRLSGFPRGVGAIVGGGLRCDFLWGLDFIMPFTPKLTLETFSGIFVAKTPLLRGKIGILGHLVKI
tara:strand:+ start:228 stop:455 length:228 start_codon:yes stop_codon:yes gene_type:complete